jgi:hypothetical protein
MAAPEFLLLVQESAYGVPAAAPVLGTNSTYIRLVDSNSFGIIADPTIMEIPRGGGFATMQEAVSDVTVVAGGLTTLLYPSQALLLLSWALQPVNGAQTSPWTTTEDPGDLASMSCYHAYQRPGGTYKTQQYKGVKVRSCRLEANRSDPRWKLSLDLVAQKNVGNPYDVGSTDPVIGTDFNAPADTDYPSGPFLFSHSVGGLLLGTGSGTVRTQYDTLTFNCANTLDERPFESRWLSICQLKGRSTTIEASKRLKATPDDRAAYESLAAQRAQVTITNGVKTVVIDMKAANHIQRLPRDLPLDKTFMETLTIKNKWSNAAGTDFTLAVT